MVNINEPSHNGRTARNRTPTTATHFYFMSMILEIISEMRFYEMAQVERLELSTFDFGDRCSAN